MYFEKPNTVDEKLIPVVYLGDFAPEAFDIHAAYVIDDDEDANPEEKDGETDDNLNEWDGATYTNPEEKEGVTEVVYSETESENDGFTAVV